MRLRGYEVKGVVWPLLPGESETEGQRRIRTEVGYTGEPYKGKLKPKYDR